jgi:hypothetical protein
MYVEITDNGTFKKFAIQELTRNELELLQNGLIEVKQHSLQDAELFKDARNSCIDMFNKIDNELIKSK